MGKSGILKSQKKEQEKTFQKQPKIVFLCSSRAVLWIYDTNHFPWLYLPIFQRLLPSLRVMLNFPLIYVPIIQPLFYFLRVTISTFLLYLRIVLPLLHLSRVILNIFLGFILQFFYSCFIPCAWYSTNFFWPFSLTVYYVCFLPCAWHLTLSFSLSTNILYSI